MQRHSTAKKYTDDMPDRIYRLALLGCEDKEIAHLIGISVATLDNWKIHKDGVQEAIDNGRTHATGKVAAALFHKATGYSHPDSQFFVIKGEITEVKTTKHYPPDTAAAIFWLKNKTRNLNTPWSDVVKTEITGKDGAPIQVHDLNNLDLSGFSDEELEMLLRINPRLKD